MPSRGTTWKDGFQQTIYDKSAESRLWRRVVIQAAKDASRGKPDQMLDVARWIKDGDDFDAVCHYAAVDPDYIAQALIDIMAMPAAARLVTGRLLVKALLMKDDDPLTAELEAGVSPSGPASP